MIEWALLPSRHYKLLGYLTLCDKDESKVVLGH